MGEWVDAVCPSRGESRSASERRLWHLLHREELEGTELSDTSQTHKGSCFSAGKWTVGPGRGDARVLERTGVVASQCGGHSEVVTVEKFMYI